MKSSKLIIVIAAIILTSCKSAVYTDPELKSHTNTHKTIAILPFTVIIKVGELSMLRKKMDEKKFKKMEATLRKKEKTEAYLIQKDLQSALLHKMKSYTIKIQNINKTNSLLEAAGVKYEDLLLKDNVEIAKILGVDAVVTGTINRDQPFTETEALALGIASHLTNLFLLRGRGYQMGYGVWANSNNLVLNAAIYDGADGNLLWEFSESSTSSYINNNTQLIQPMLKKISRKFPYYKAV